MHAFHRAYFECVRAHVGAGAGEGRAPSPAGTILDFAPEFVDQIHDGRKEATCRSLRHEPSLGSIAAGDIVLATTRGGREVFGALRIDGASRITFGGVTDELARAENLETRERMRAVLLGFYPDLVDASELVVYSFRLLR